MKSIPPSAHLLCAQTAKKALKAFASGRYKRGYSLTELGIAFGVAVTLIVSVLFVSRTATQKLITDNSLSDLDRILQIATEKTAFGTAARGDDVVSMIESTGAIRAGNFIANSAGSSKARTLAGNSARIIKLSSGIEIAILGNDKGSFGIGITSMRKGECIAFAQALLQDRYAMNHFAYISTLTKVDTVSTASAPTDSAAAPTTIASSSKCGAQPTPSLYAIYK